MNHLLKDDLNFMNMTIGKLTAMGILNLGLLLRLCAIPFTGASGQGWH